MDIGMKIKNRREELGMSQEELARLSGYKSRSSINKLEVDGRGIPQQKLFAIAKALQVTPTYLLGIDEDKEHYLNEEAAMLAQEVFDRPELRVLFDASRDVSKEDILYVAQMLEKLKK